MRLLKAPELRIKLAKDGNSLVIINAQEKEHSIPCRLTDANAAEYRLALKKTLDEAKAILRGERLSLKDANNAFEKLNTRGLSLIFQIFPGNWREVVKIFQESFPGWKTQKQPAAITVEAELNRLVPLDLLPLFEPAEWPRVGDRGIMEGAARRFLGFSTIIRREFATLRVTQNLVLNNNPKLPLKCFYDRGLAGADSEISFFKRNAGRKGCLDFDGPWPENQLDPREFHKSLADHLRHADRRFNGKHRALSDQVQHFVCHCDIDDTVSSDSQLRFSDGNTVSIAELQARFLIIEEGKVLEEGKQAQDGPLIFLNACGTSRIDPMAITSFPRFFLEDNRNRGFIGTETNIPDAFAANFSRAFYSSLLKGIPLGQAIHNAKWEMLRVKNNPLGILYIVYADPDLHVSKPVADLN